MIHITNLSASVLNPALSSFRHASLSPFINLILLCLLFSLLIIFNFSICFFAVLLSALFICQMEKANLLGSGYFTFDIRYKWPLMCL